MGTIISLPYRNTNFMMTKPATNFMSDRLWTGTTTCMTFTDLCLDVVKKYLTSSSSYSHFYMGLMYDDKRLHVAWSYTSSAESGLISFSLSNHVLLGLPLFLLSCTFHIHHVVPLILSFLILSSFVTLDSWVKNMLLRKTKWDCINHCRLNYYRNLECL